MKSLAAALAVLLAAGPASAQIVVGPVVPGAPFGFGHPGKHVVVSVTIGGPALVARPVGFGYWHHGVPVVPVTTIVTPPVIIVPVIPVIPFALVPPDSELPQLAVPRLPPRQAPPPQQPPPPAPKPAPAPPPAPPKPDPTAEAERLVTTGREAFAVGEYGRAADRFARAAGLNPDQPLANFLLAQALFAQGRYEPALTALEAAFRTRPAGPGAAFVVRALYGNQGAELDRQIEQLRGALARFPDDAVLQFLLGYELWFDRRRDEAKPLLRRAAPRLPLPGPFERFVNGLDGPVVKQ